MEQRMSCGPLSVALPSNRAAGARCAVNSGALWTRTPAHCSWAHPRVLVSCKPFELFDPVCNCLPEPADRCCDHCHVQGQDSLEAPSDALLRGRR